MLDPEVMGELPIFAKNNMEKMFLVEGQRRGEEEDGDGDGDEAELRYVPVKVYGETPKGFTTLWQREYLRKKKAAREERKRMMEMQMAMMQSTQNVKMEQQMNEMELAMADGSVLM